MPNNELNSQVAVIELGSLTTDGHLVPALHLPHKSKILSVKLMNGATVAADNSHYFQLALKKGSTVVAEMDSRAAHEDGVTANTSKALNIVDGQEEQDAGSDLSVLYNETGTVALTDAKLMVHYFRY